MKRDVRKMATVAGLVLLGLVAGGCGESRSHFAGTYKSVEPVADKGNIVLNLQEDGRGTWALAGKTVEFTWVINDGKIWFYTKPGAIIIVTPSEEGKVLSADMSGEWHSGCPPGSCVLFRRTAEGG
jgi:hypothetical protein